VARTFDENAPDELGLVGITGLPDELLDLEEFEDDGHDFDAAGDPLPVLQATSRQGGPELSALSSFQRSADRFPQLTPPQQLELARVYRDGVAARVVLATGKVTKREREKLQEQVRRSEFAMEHLCASCWRLAWLIVREQAERRFGREKATDLLPDLMQEANGALVQAVRDFDPTRTPSFHTYAAQGVRNHTRMVLGRDGYLRLAPAWVRI
jgi:hypothetical protein